jgi:hypothetical protein
MEAFVEDVSFSLRKSIEQSLHLHVFDRGADVVRRG